MIFDSNQSWLYVLVLSRTKLPRFEFAAAIPEALDER
jgi:hypothetical protein